jgi:hypothetical protein
VRRQRRGSRLQRARHHEQVRPHQHRPGVARGLHHREPHLGAHPPH